MIRVYGNRWKSTNAHKRFRLPFVDALIARWSSETTLFRQINILGREIKAHRKHGGEALGKARDLGPVVVSEAKALHTAMTTIMADAVDLAVAAAVHSATATAPAKTTTMRAGQASAPAQPNAPTGEKVFTKQIRNMNKDQRALNPCPFKASTRGCSHGAACQFLH